ncbi:MAG: pyridoxal-phosphate dependent enzyme [Deltaproteobacteria bacterium]|jgi:threonine dehydratase|nr:pyridoxal-phosphate dependent enzyme [Deltaproteobacteria bacterium]
MTINYSAASAARRPAPGASFDASFDASNTASNTTSFEAASQFGPSVAHSELFNQVMLARTRIYSLFPPTPTEVHPMPQGWTMLLKREDLSEIHSYKWRGAYNFISVNFQKARVMGLVAASAGNHAQGVAVSARRLGLKAHLFMPKSAPRLKIDSVARLGGDKAEIHLEGDAFDDAAEAAREFAEKTGGLMVPPYDDPLVMAGQGVVADEMMTDGHRPDVVFVQIGGGGLAAGMATVIKTYAPDVLVVGVEQEGQASMKAAFEAGRPTPLSHLDIFCDGTAVKKAGEKTYPILKAALDDLVTVSDAEVAQAMEMMWRTARVLAEPSGVLGLAAALKHPDLVRGKKVGLVVSGANLDFRRLTDIAGKTGDPASRQSFYRVTMPERQGSMLSFFKTIASQDLNISHLMVGQNNSKIAFPVIGFDGFPPQFKAFEKTMESSGYVFENVTNRPDLPFRVAPFEPGLYNLPLAVILEFPERPGALYEFLDRISSLCNISYFNYVHTGEQVGRAMAVFSFASLDDRRKFKEELKNRGPSHISLPAETILALGLPSDPEDEVK